jgi:hypothetical protein
MLIKIPTEKDLQNVSKILVVMLLCGLAVSCGGQIPRIPVDGGGGDVSTPTPTPFPTPKPITCTGTSASTTGIICDEGTPNDPDYYNHWQWQIALRPDGSGTFTALTETGISVGSTREIILDFPANIHITEIHANANVVAWCNNLGAVSLWNGAATNGPLEQIVSAKTFIFNTGGTADYSMPQIIFPQPPAIKQLYLFNNTDLCAHTTISWALNGSFVP